MIETSTANNRTYEKQLARNVERFFAIVAEKTKDMHPYIHNICTTTCTARGGHSKELLFYRVIGGPKDD